MKKVLFMVLFLFPFYVLAQDASPVPSAVAGPVLSTGIQDWINAHLGMIGTYGGLLVTEVVMRVWPTAKPASLLLVASKVVNWVSSLLAAISGVIDNVLQNVPKS